ncbi:hypothetical protein [Sphingomonas sp. Ag1]|uniref:hypothetical protein n=1 Tax=Sphingomonas sp. Ag1 TaxID=1642949 RepID=UPI000621585B|nr:hypothetical protein [Sphingomonas sp. Ag1]KKI21967.1 hypothetical protein XM50_01355 [Sphingomonas sp. Ag1]
MRSSDQRYRHVQRKKRETQQWELASRDLAFALRDVRRNEGDFSAVEAAIKAGAAEFNHVLLASGRTATDFRRNFRVGSPNWHIVNANAICPIGLLQRERLDGFVLMRLSREQAKNVKLRWAKLRDQDRLLHDPQGAHWSEIVGCHVDGERDEHLAVLTGLREAGVNVLAVQLAKGEAEREFHEYKTTNRPWVRPFVSRYEDEAEDEASCCFSMALAGYELQWRKNGGPSQAKVRAAIEHNLVVAEAFAAGQGFEQAYYAPDTSNRRCSDAKLKERIDAILSIYGERWRDIIEAQRENYQ